MSIIDNVLGRLGVRCRHNQRSMPFHDERQGNYTVCLECGKKFKFIWAVLVTDHPYLRDKVHAG